MPLRPLSVAVVLSLAAAAFASGPTVRADLDSYAYDIESNHAGGAYRTGRTLFGQHMALYGDWRPDPRVRVAVGLFWTLRFGDDAEALREGIEPYVFLEIADGGPSELRFGNLDRCRQALDPLLIDPVRFLDRPTDRGVAHRYERGALRTDAWIQWRERNTPEQRESFDVGLDARLALTPTLTALVQGHLVHHGGELYSVGPVSDNWAGTAGLAWRPALSEEARGLLALQAYGSAERRFRNEGDGVAVRAGLERGGWTGELRLWRGDGFHAEDGHPYGLADELTSWTVARRWRVAGLVDGELGFAGHHVDGDFEQEFWLRLTTEGLELW